MESPRIVLLVTVGLAWVGCDTRNFSPDAPPPADAGVADGTSDARDANDPLDGACSPCLQPPAMVEVRADCTFSLPCGYPYASGALDVFTDGLKVPRDPTGTSGWDYIDASMTSVRLYGAPCTDVLAGTISKIDITPHCGIQP